MQSDLTTCLTNMRKPVGPHLYALQEFVVVSGMIHGLFPFLCDSGPPPYLFLLLQVDESAKEVVRESSFSIIYN